MILIHFCCDIDWIVMVMILIKYEGYFNRQVRFCLWWGIVVILIVIVVILIKCDYYFDWDCYDFDWFCCDIDCDGYDFD